MLPNGNITEYYYLGREGGLATVYIKTTAGSSTTSVLYGIMTDHLGNINGLISTDCKIADACMYSPCSRVLQTRKPSAAGLASNRNPDEYKRNREGNRCTVGNWEEKEASTVTHMLDRGFTGHEHLDKFGLINMNGRMYDPYLGEFLSPDPFVQAPDNAQNFNRYAYCLNNPMIYTDPSGELFVVDDILIGAAIGAALGGTTGGLGAWFSGGSGKDIFNATWKGMVTGIVTGAITGGSAEFLNRSMYVYLNTSKAVARIGSSAIAGGIGGGAAPIVNAVLSNTSVSGNQIGQSAFYGMIGGAFGGGFNNPSIGTLNGIMSGAAMGGLAAGGSAIVGSIGWALLNGNSNMEVDWSGIGQNMIMGMIAGGALGGVKGYRNASILGVNKITGGTIQERTQAWADYHFGKGRFKASVFDEINIKNLNEISSKFKFRQEFPNTYAMEKASGVEYIIDGYFRNAKVGAFFTKQTIRNMGFEGGWGKGTMFHEYTHFGGGKDDLAYKIGLRVGGRSYFNHCREHFTGSYRYNIGQ